MTRSALAVILALGLLAAPTAAAPPSAEARARAGESFREAQAAFERRDYAAAAAAFEAAAGFAPHPAALLSAGDAWERAGEPARAAEDCDRARSLPGVAEASAVEHVDYARDAAQCLARLRQRVASLDVRAPSPATARIDDGATQLLPVHAWLRPGHHAVTVVDLGTSRTRRDEIDLRPGEERQIDLASPPAPSVPPLSAPPSAGLTVTAVPPSPSSPEPAAPSRRVPAAAWIAGGVAVPAAIAWGVFAAMTVQAKNAYDAGPTDDTKNTFYRDRTLADVTFALAAAAAATGLVLWLVAPSDAPRATGLVAPGVLRF